MVGIVVPDILGRLRDHGGVPEARGLGGPPGGEVGVQGQAQLMLWVVVTKITWGKKS